MLEFGFPFLAPICAQAARHDHSDQTDQPEPETKASCTRHIGHRRIRVAARSSDQLLLLVARKANMPESLRMPTTTLRRRPSTDQSDLPRQANSSPPASRIRSQLT